MNKLYGCILCFVVLPLFSFSQKPPELSSSEIFHKLEKLGTLANVLYVAAHPDDENTSLISYFSNNRHYNTVYLSLTRGDGGQNLIGPEIGPLLGVIRTQELLAARRIDGGNQFFSRAIDFGYSKHPDETFEIWNKEEVLHDVVWAIRKFRPDIIVNRFDHRSPGSTHGHHTGSAILSYEAFDLAADPSAFTHQLEYVEPWQPQRLFFNTSWWFYGSREKFESANKSDHYAVDVGVYYPLLGQSNNEISAISRSQHRCQGFGRIGSRGEEKDYLEFLKGDEPSGSDPFSGINTTWSRVEGGEKIMARYEKIVDAFDFTNPAAIVPQLMDLLGAILSMPDHAFKSEKIAECTTLIEACLGLYLEVRSPTNHLIPGQEYTLAWEAINRSEIPVSIRNVEILPVGEKIPVEKSLTNNLGMEGRLAIRLPEEAFYTNPYWLNNHHSLGLYIVDDLQNIGLPESPRYLQARFELEIEGQQFTVTRDVVHVEGRPDRGEVYKPVEVIPAFTIHVLNPILFFQEGQSQTLGVQVRNHQANRMPGDTLKLEMPDGFQSKPAYFLLDDDENSNFIFEISGPDIDLKSVVRAVVTTRDGKVYDRTMTLIDYDHIPLQTILQPAQATVVSLQLQTAVHRIGYIQGAGDELPRFLTEIGISTEVLTPSDIPHSKLDNFDAIVLGVRALNTVDGIDEVMPELLQYAHQGGTLVLQYNTGHDLKTSRFAPFQLDISRSRVTDENSPVQILNVDHRVLNFPNSISEKDFEGWVQERGLYFPGTYASEYETVVAFKDPGEEYLPEGLLIAPYGKGHYVYTGLSFFRQLPAGVPGAFKLFVNILSLDQAQN